jgi:short subunit dehydrogenase-like uncharacterized protein
LSEATIAVVGATGFTGRLLVEELAGERLVLVGRNGRTLRRMATAHRGSALVRMADVTDGAALRTALIGSSVVVNASGPYRTLGPPVLRAAVRAGAHYVDCAAEQPFLVDAAAHHPAVAATGLLALPGSGCDFALAFCAASLLAARLGPLRRVRTLNWMPDFRPSRGTVRSMIGMVDARFVRMRSGRAWPVAVAPRPVSGFPGCLAVGFPGGEPILLPHAHPHLTHVRHQLVLPRNEALGFSGAMAARRLVASAWPRWATGRLTTAADGSVSDPSEHQRAAAELVVEVHAASSSGRGTVRIEAVDPYGLTARILAVCARWLAAGRATRSGVLGTGDALDPGALLDAVGVRWVMRSEP